MSRDKKRLNHELVENISAVEQRVDIAGMLVPHVGFCPARRNGSFILRKRWNSLQWSNGQVDKLDSSERGSHLANWFEEHIDLW